MNTEAIHIPQQQLLGELDRRIESKKRAVAERDSLYGAGRVRVSSYMENIGWPELFGYNMNRFLEDADFSIQQHLRQLIFWADNVDDDTVPGFYLQADVGMYWDMTLFGQMIVHSPTGVPHFSPHPFQLEFNPATLGRFEFTETGDMPRLLAKYHQMREISAAKYDGKIAIGFPSFHRGPLDIYVQLRGYEGFLEDLADRPDELAATLCLLVSERRRFAEARSAFLGHERLPESSFVADDWVNVPFINPRFFRETLVPVYALIRQLEGPITGFHTCGNMGPVVGDLLQVFPEITCLDVSGWNDIEYLDRVVDTQVRFQVAIINSVSLSDDVPSQLEKLNAIRAVYAHREVGVTAQAIVNLYPPYEETLKRLNRFIDRAYSVLPNN